MLKDPENTEAAIQNCTHAANIWMLRFKFDATTSMQGTNMRQKLPYHILVYETLPLCYKCLVLDDHTYKRVFVSYLGSEELPRIGVTDYVVYGVRSYLREHVDGPTFTRSRLDGPCLPSTSQLEIPASIKSGSFFPHILQQISAIRTNGADAVFDMDDTERRTAKRSRFDQKEPEPRKASRFDRRSRSPSRRKDDSVRDRSPLDKNRDAEASPAKSPVDPAAAAGKLMRPPC